MKQNETQKELSVTPEARQAKALELSLEGHGVEHIARVLGVSRGTIWRYRSETTFAARLLKAQEARANEAEARLQLLTSDAITYLATVLRDPAEPTVLRMKAASELLNRGGLDSATATRERISKQAEAFMAAVLETICAKLPETQETIFELLEGTSIEPDKPQATLTLRIKKGPGQ